MKYIRSNDGEIWKGEDIEINSRDLWEGYIIKNNCIYEKEREWDGSIADEKYYVKYTYI